MPSYSFLERLKSERMRALRRDLNAKILGTM